MKKNFLTSLIVFILIIIFIIWIFNLETVLDEDKIGDNLKIIFEKAFSEIKSSFKDMMDGIETLKEEDLPKLLEDEQINQLKEKVLEYGKEQ